MRNINFDKKLFLKIILFILSLVAVLCLILFLLYLWAIKSGSIPPPTKYVRGDINDVVYAEPTQEAKNFDIEGHINSLPSVEYEKIDYPVKETYTYEFNDYILTVDVPEGFEVYEVGLPKKPRVIDSEGVEDSYECVGGVCTGPKYNWFKPASEQASDMLCIDSKFKKKEYCDTDSIQISLRKSKYKGVSFRDVYMHQLEYTNNKVKYISNDTFFAGTSHKVYSYMGALLSDQQGLVMALYSHATISKDLYFSIIDSIKIQKK